VYHKVQFLALYCFWPTSTTCQKQQLHPRSNYLQMAAFFTVLLTTRLVHQRVLELAWRQSLQVLQSAFCSLRTSESICWFWGWHHSILTCVEGGGVELCQMPLEHRNLLDRCMLRLNVLTTRCNKCQITNR
jgi:hypothetical protein